MLKHLLILVAVFIPTAIFGQVNGFVNYTQEDGLHASYTYMLSQDKDGYIWIGSDNGLFRFDGVEFKNYNGKNGLRNIDVLEVIPMADGRVFVAPFLSDFAYLKNDTVYNSQSDPQLKQLRLNSASRFTLKADSLKEHLYIYEQDQPKEIFTYAHDKLETIPLAIHTVSPSLSYSILDYDFKETLLLCVRAPGLDCNEIYRYNLRTHALASLNTLVKKYLLNYYAFGHGLFCFISKTGVLVYDSPTATPKQIDFSRPIHWVRMMGKERFWVSFIDGGIAYYDLRRDPGIKSPVMLMDDYVMNDVLVDRDGNVWFSTKDNGIFFIEKQAFNNYVRLPIKNNSSCVTSLSANRSSIILAYNMGNGSLLKGCVLHDFVLNRHLKYNNSLVVASEDKAVFGMGNASYQLDLKNYSIKNLGLPSTYCKNLVSATKESVLFCMGNNLSEYNLVSGRHTTYLFGKVYSALPFAKDSLFVGSFNDLYKFNTVTQTKIPFLVGYYFTDLKRIDADHFIGATNGNGIILFNRRGVTRRITESDGLANNQVKRIEVQNATTFWAATNSGLCRVQLGPDSLSIMNFTRQDGLFSDKVSGCAIRNDTIYVGTAKGLTILPIKSLLNQPRYISKQVLINSITIGHKTYLKPQQKYAATYPENNVVFYLSFLDYPSLGKVSYRYNIEGLNNYWQVSSSPKILLNGLPPGNYIFKVYGLTHNGKQSYSYTELPFEIKPQFWQTWWFQLFTVVELCVLVLVVVNRIIQRRKDKKLGLAIYEKKIAELELQAIKAQINPHFIYNCLNSIQFLLYKKDYAETENYLDAFAQMIRKTLHYSEKTFMPIEEEIEYLSLYLNMEQLRFKTGFHYAITAADDVNLNWKIPTLLVQPFVENALKHGIDQLTGKGMVEVLFEYAAPLLCIIIRDNGVGIKSKLQPENKLDSFGIKLSQKRIDTFKQLFHTEITFEIRDLSETGGQGTEIKFYLNAL